MFSDPTVIPLLQPWVATLIEWILGAAFLTSLFRLFRGPNAVDRVLVLDLITGIFLCLIVFHGIEANDPNYLNIALVMAVLSFLGTSALSRYLENRDQSENTK